MEMTLDEAITHAREVAITLSCNNETRECGKEHLQLAKWLEELKLYRKHYLLPKEEGICSF